MRKVALLALFAALLWPGAVEAACSGSGLTWSCTSGSTLANIASAYSSGTDGMTITVDAGSYTWSGRMDFSMTKGATIICASVAGCTVSSGGTLWGWGSGGGTSTKLYRISGFDITHNSSFMIYACPGGSCAATTLTQFRFDHNILRSSTSQMTFMMLGDTASSDYYVYGLADHNTLLCTQTCSISQHTDAQSGSNSGAPSRSMGSASNMYYEDNSIAVTTVTDTGSGFIDGWAGGIVARFNTLLNSRILQHGVTHGWGPVNFEVYGNDFSFDGGANGTGIDDCTRVVHHQGSGTFIVFGNKCTPRTGAGHGAWPALLHYRSTRNALSNRCDGTVGVDGNRVGDLGYPCKRQPGRDVDGTLFPVYTWANKYGDDNTRSALSCEEADTGVGNPTACGHHIVADRDRFDGVSINAQSSASSPFDGTTGMGFGTLANRPTTCSKGGTEAADAGAGGVGYFATDQGSWNSSSSNPYGVQQNGADGVLYNCPTANTWSTYYTPYTYPHPLQGAAGGGSSSGTRGKGKTKMRGKDVAFLALGFCVSGWRLRRRNLREY